MPRKASTKVAKEVDKAIAQDVVQDDDVVKAAKKALNFETSNHVPLTQGPLIANFIPSSFEKSQGHCSLLRFFKKSRLKFPKT